MIRYRCLLLDHDDTVFDSTRHIHYPAFLETLSQLRPNDPPLPYSTFLHWCHALGFQKIIDEVYHFDKDELSTEYAIWKQYTQKHIPEPFEGMKDLLIRYHEEGGRIVVVSHSESSEIKRDYLTHFGFEPDLVFGWELGIDQRKPNPYPVETTLQTLNLLPKDCLMVDDMRMGLDLVKPFGIAFALASWSHGEPEIVNDMKSASTYVLESVEALSKLVFG
jgi:phosphoglycolate phosphatase/pyrophosphatase PpaX